MARTASISGILCGCFAPRAALLLGWAGGFFGMHAYAHAGTVQGWMHEQHRRKLQLLHTPQRQVSSAVRAGTATTSNTQRECQVPTVAPHLGSAGGHISVAATAHAGPAPALDARAKQPDGVAAPNGSKRHCRRPQGLPPPGSHHRGPDTAVGARAGLIWSLVPSPNGAARGQ